MTTYTKLRSGEWGIRVQGQAGEGQQVIVTKRDGSTRVETVARVLWRGDGVALCAVARHTHGGGSGMGRRERRSSKVCWETGGYCYSLDGSPYCEECGDHMYR